VRTLVGVTLVTVCLGLAGCSLFGKKQTARNNNGTPKPFLGSETPAKAETTALPRSSNGPLPGANGLLAGRVVAQSSGQPIQAVIRVVNLENEDAKTAELDVWTDQSGYFTISGLKVGGQYELIARAKDGGDLISRMVFEKPPKAALFIEMDKRYTTAKTPPVPDAPKPPEKKSTAGADNAPEQTSAVGIGPPVRLPDQEAPPRVNLNNPLPDNGGAATPGGANSPNPANIADGGFQRVRPPSETVTIPSPPPLPRPPQWENVPNDSPPRGAPIAPGPPGSVDLPRTPTTVPSCVLTGNRLYNFALYNIDGRVWEYQQNKNKNGRLMLLDFWHHQCQYCLTGMHHLVDLQRDYGPYGLEVVGIACEIGPVEQQRRDVFSARGRYHINFPTLLSGGSNSPILTQFQVHYFPLLVLLDENGTILWRSSDQGMDDYAYESLTRMINNRLIMQKSP
jgi:thiol-disulfide isomerase/thioredoxin